MFGSKSNFLPEVSSVLEYEDNLSERFCIAYWWPLRNCGGQRQIPGNCHDFQKWEDGRWGWHKLWHDLYKYSTISCHTIKEYPEISKKLMPFVIGIGKYLLKIIIELLIRV